MGKAAFFRSRLFSPLSPMQNAGIPFSHGSCLRKQQTEAGDAGGSAGAESGDKCSEREGTRKMPLASFCTLLDVPPFFVTFALSSATYLLCRRPAVFRQRLPPPASTRKRGRLRSVLNYRCNQCCRPLVTCRPRPSWLGPTATAPAGRC